MTRKDRLTPIRNNGRMHALVKFSVVASICICASSARAESDGRILRKEATVSASLDDVWHAWTTSEGIASFFSPESNIELRPGGAYEFYMSASQPDESGKRGTEGCKLLSYSPREMLSFEWNFPPKVMNLRKSGAKTHVVLTFDEVAPAQTRVRFAQLGWQKGEDWDAGYTYFDNAWSFVFNNLKEKAEAKAIPSAPGKLSKLETKSWSDGRVKVTATGGPEKSQTFEMLVPLPVEQVWEALATTDGLRKLSGGPHATVDLVIGGAYQDWPGVSHEILSYVPGEMISGVGSAPPGFPNVQKGGTWWVYRFIDAGRNRTKLRMSLMGWRDGEKEWDDAFDYFLKANPSYLNGIYGKMVAERNDTRHSKG